MSKRLTSKAVERATDLSGSYIRKLVRDGRITPERDSSGRFLYSEADIEVLRAMRRGKNGISSGR